MRLASFLYLWLALNLSKLGSWYLLQDADAFVVITPYLVGWTSSSVLPLPSHHNINYFSTSTIHRCGSSGSNDGTKRRRDEYQKGMWTTNDFRTFLNQCTVQSSLFLVRQMRDVQTVAWLEEFTQPTVLFRQSELERDQIENYQTGQFVEPSAHPDNDEATATEPSLSSKLLRYHGLGAMDPTDFQRGNRIWNSSRERRKFGLSNRQRRIFQPMNWKSILPRSVGA
jgi:hypothetical protein